MTTLFFVMQNDSFLKEMDATRTSFLQRNSAWSSWSLGFILHILTGLIAVCAHYSLMWLMLKLNLPELAASSIGFTAGATTRYALSHFKVFKPSNTIQTTLTRFILSLMLQMLANLILLELLMHLNFGVWVSQIIVTVTLAFTNYILYRLWVFK